jgi:hypothetical protein
VDATQSRRATFGIDSEETNVPVEIAHKLAEKREKGLAKAHKAYKNTKEQFIQSVLSDAKEIYEVDSLYSNQGWDVVPSRLRYEFSA